MRHKHKLLAMGLFLLAVVLLSGCGTGGRAGATLEPVATSASQATVPLDKPAFLFLDASW